MLKVMHRQSYSDSDVSSKKMESWYISWGSGIKTCLHLDKGPPCKRGKVCRERIESEIAQMWEGCSPSLLTLFYFLHLPCDVKSRKICHLLWVRVLSCCGLVPSNYVTEEGMSTLSKGNTAPDLEGPEAHSSKLHPATNLRVRLEI